jgi:hypothetical protein
MKFLVEAEGFANLLIAHSLDEGEGRLVQEVINKNSDPYP